MKVGDLIKMVEFGHPKDSPEGIKERELWSQPAVIIKGPYEAQINHAGATGKVRYVELIRAVDVMIDGDVIRRIPIKYLRRVNDMI